MKRGLRISIAIVAVAALGVVVFQFLKSRELSYGGHTLNYWLREYRYRDARSTPPHQWQVKAADEAIRAIGTNAIPVMVEMLEGHDSRFKRYVIDQMNRRSWLSIDWQTSGERRLMAKYGLMAFETEPKIIVPVFTNLLTNPDRDLQDFAAYQLSQMGPSARDAVPALIQCLKNDSNGVAQGYELEGFSMGSNGPRTFTMTQPPSRESVRCLEALTAIRSDARTAVPVILPLLTNNDFEIRRNADLAIAAIAPELARSNALRELPARIRNQ